MELSEYSQGMEGRKGATRIGRRGSWLAAVACAIVATNVVLYLAPRIAPAATIRPGAVAFAIGMVSLLAGLVLRGGRSRHWASTSLSPSWSAPTSRWSPPASIACCAIPATPESFWPAPASALRSRTGPAWPALRCCRWPW